MFILTIIDPEGDNRFSVPTILDVVEMLNNTNWESTMRVIIERKE